MRRVPPSGRLPRDPTASARLLDAAAEVGLRVERLYRDVDAVERAVEELAVVIAQPPPGHTRQDPDPHQTADVRRHAGVMSRSLETEARALAIDLAVGGASRASIHEQIRERYGPVDVDDMLDALFRSDQ